MATANTGDERFLKRAEVSQMTGLASATLYQMMQRNEFPRPIKLGKKAVRWRLSELNEYFASCPRYTPTCEDGP